MTSVQNHSWKALVVVDELKTFDRVWNEVFHGKLLEELTSSREKLVLSRVSVFAWNPAISHQVSCTRKDIIFFFVLQDKTVDEKATVVHIGSSAVW